MRPLYNDEETEMSISVAYVAEIERLRHDIERHIAIASELATENEGLRDELARKAEGYTRLAEVHEGAMKLWESQEREAEMKAYEMAAELKGLREEIERLRAELAEARKPTCNACANFHSCWSRSWNNPSWARVFCPDGERFERVDPVRLYEIDAAMAGGEK